MQPFPPSIVQALLNDSRRHDLNDEVRAIRERSRRSPLRARRSFRFRTDGSRARVGRESTEAA
jgi:hypothetical protein